MVESFPFDPNTADSTTLLRLGFKPWQAKAICNYRRKGGRWRSAEDCKRIYGFSEADYQRLKPYIRISPEFAASAPRQKSEKQLLWEARQAHFDSLRFGSTVYSVWTSQTSFFPLPFSTISRHALASHFSRSARNFIPAPPLYRTMPFSSRFRT